MKKLSFDRTLEVLAKITNKIVNDPNNTRTGITYGEALITHKQMDWFRKVYTMDCGGVITEGGCQSITGNEYEYGISGKPINKWGSYIIQVFPKTQKAYDDLRARGFGNKIVKPYL